jgi:hypothetical protein
LRRLYTLGRSLYANIRLNSKQKQCGKEREFIQTTKNIVDACIVDVNGKVDVDKLPMYAIDFLFLKMRSKSISNVVTAVYTCHNKVPSSDEDPNAPLKDCDSTFKVFINLDDVYLRFPEDYAVSSIIEVTSTLGMKLKTPTFDAFRTISLKDKGPIDITDEYVFACIEHIFDEDKIYVPFKDFSLEELKTFIDDLPTTTLDQIIKFFDNQPTISLTLNITCPKCKNVSTVELNGLNDFFE